MSYIKGYGLLKDIPYGKSEGEGCKKVMLTQVNNIKRWTV